MKGAREEWSLAYVASAHGRDKLPQDLLAGWDGQSAVPWLSSLPECYLAVQT